MGVIKNMNSIYILKENKKGKYFIRYNKKIYLKDIKPDYTIINNHFIKF